MFEENIFLNNRLDTFLVLCETRNYTKAAEILCITQPAVTQHIKWLQDTLNITLLYYDHFHNLCLTDEGNALRIYAQKMKADTLKVINLIHNGNNNLKKYNIGTQVSAGETFVPKAIAQYLELYPDSLINHTLGESDDLIQQLKAGNIDFCIADISCDTDFYHVKKLFYSEIICICSPEHPLANKEVDFKELYQYRLISRTNYSYYYTNLSNILLRNNHNIDQFNKVCNASTLSAAKSLIKENVGIGFFYDFAIKDEMEKGALSKIRIRDFKQLKSINIIWIKDSIFAEKYSVFQDICEKIVENCNFN